MLRPGADVEPKQLPELTAALAAASRDAIRGLADRAAAIPGLVLPPGGIRSSEEGRELVDRQVDWLTMGRAAGRSARPEQADVAKPCAGAGRQRSATRPGSRYVQACEALPALSQCCAVEQSAVADWAGEGGLVDRWRSTAAGATRCRPDLGSLRRWLAFVEHLEPLRTAG